MQTAVLSSPLLGGTRMQEQVERENRSVARGIADYWERVDETVRSGRGSAVHAADHIVRQWYAALAQAVEIEVTEVAAFLTQPCAALGRPGINDWGPIMLAGEASRMATVAAHSILSSLMQGRGGAVKQDILRQCGHAVVTDIAYLELRHVPVSDDVLHISVAQAIERKFKQGLSPRLVARFAKRSLSNDWFRDRVYIQMGARFLSLLIETTMWRDEHGVQHPAILCDEPVKGSKRLTYYRLDPKVWDSIEQGHAAREHRRPRFRPMVVSPLEWSPETMDGGYYVHRVPLVTRPRSEHMRLLAASENKRFLDGINAMHSSPVRIHGAILALQRRVFERGDGEKLGIPSRESQIVWPSRLPEGADKDLVAAHKRYIAKLHEREVKEKSPRTMFDNRLAAAEDDADKDGLWLPVQCCFRGRMQPITSVLSYNTDPAGRAMLEWSVPVDASGEDARRWLLIHAANAWGNDKLPFAERVAWSREHSGRMRRVAEDPEGDDWWHEAEDPWGFLSACMALSDPERGARAMLQIDGTANGLQNLAAMALDPACADLVNMGDWRGDDSTPPRDLYAALALQCKRRCQQDCNDGNSIAKACLPFVTRSVVKAPGMTSLYGVTAYGSVDQVAASLEDAFKALPSPPEKGLSFACARYLAPLVLGAMRDIAPGAMALLDWFKVVAKVTAFQHKDGKATRRPEHRLPYWSAPDGFVCRPPYEAGERQIRTSIGVVSVRSMGKPRSINPRKLVNSMAANFTHMYDAAHLRAVRLAMEERGSDMVARHDAYVAHAANMDRLGVITRDEFVKLHTPNRLAEFHAQVQAQYPDRVIPLPPERGSYDLSLVRGNPYFFH